MTERQIYSLCETVADIAFIAGEEKYFSGDSRKDIADFIEWANEFEAQHENIEWGVNSEKDYYDAVIEFAKIKMNPPA